MKQIWTERLPIMWRPIGTEDVDRNYDCVYGGEISSELSVPTEQGGVRFNRHMMNGIAYAASVGTVLQQYGYPIGERRKEISDIIGGFPKGAVLTFIDDNGYVLEYESKVDDNEADFPSYDGKILVEDDNWRPVITTNQYFGIPDFTNIISQVNVEGVKDSSFTFSTPELKSDAYVVIEAQTPNLHNEGKWDVLFGFPDIEVFTIGPSGNTVILGRIQIGGTSEKITSTYTVGVGSKIGVMCKNYNYSVYNDFNLNIMAYGMTTGTSEVKTDEA